MPSLQRIGVEALNHNRFIRFKLFPDGHLSPRSVRGKDTSDYHASICYNEIKCAQFQKKPIVPISVIDFPGAPPFLINSYKLYTLLGWATPEIYDAEIAKIIAVLSRIRNSGFRYLNIQEDIAAHTGAFAIVHGASEDNSWVFSGREWLFDLIDTWLDGQERSLLIEGGTGTGKTTISAELVRRNKEGRILAHHFCDSFSQGFGRISAIQSIIAMFAHSVPAYGVAIRLGTHSHALDSRDAAVMLTQGFLFPLKQIPMNTTYYMLIDSIDESIGAKDSFEDSLAHLILENIGNFPDWLKLLVTARPNTLMAGTIPQQNKTTLGTDDQIADMKSYIEMRLSSGPMTDRQEFLRENSASIKVEVSRICGMNFRHAEFLLNDLESGATHSSNLVNISENLDGYYTKFMTRAFPPGQDLGPVETTLSVIIAAMEPLGSGDIAAISAFNLHSVVMPTLNALGGFLRLERNRRGQNVYQLAHKSIADWLLENAPDHFRVRRKIGEEEISAYCKTWRSKPDSYALKYLLRHLVKYGETESALREIVDGFFAERSRLLDEELHTRDMEDTFVVAASLIRLKHKSGLLAISSTENIWQRDGVAAALEAASEEDRDFINDVVEALLTLKG